MYVSGGRDFGKEGPSIMVTATYKFFLAGFGSPVPLRYVQTKQPNGMKLDLLRLPFTLYLTKPLLMINKSCNPAGEKI